MNKTHPLCYRARPNQATQQSVLPGRYRGWVMALSMAAFTLAFLGWFNESWLYLYENPIWLNRYTEYAIILAFGIWRIRAEEDPYTRKRLIILVTVVTLFWWFIPWLTPVFEPYAGYVWSRPLFPAPHTPGTVTFFLVLLLVLLFGRRIICGFGCPCVGIRETAGFPFRRFTLRSDWAWRLRHTKWLFFTWYVVVMVATQFPPNTWTTTLVGLFALVVGLTYFGSFFIIPITGNRFYCRYLCPYGSTFGLLNHAGFYGIKMDIQQCIDCRRCEQVCDMGIPVWKQGRENGEVTGLEDCMGCARCVVSCPTDALAIHDVRNLIRPALRQDASHLLKRQPNQPKHREAIVYRQAAERKRDWKDVELPLSRHVLQQQADRCLDCGVPGCRGACPLGNHIPDWLAATARGDWEHAAELVHATSPLPEVCGTICPQQRLCESGCTRRRLEGAVHIGLIEKSVAEQALEAGWRMREPADRSGIRAAVIGAGPAGLSCAERLNRAGVEVTVHDRAERIGGLLQSAVPGFKLDKRLLKRRQAMLEEVGIHFSLGTPVDEVMLCRLVDSHDAVFLGLGAQKPRTVDLPGQQLEGVVQAIDWLPEVNSGNSDALSGESLLVLGGGDTAMDCARTAIRLGAEVTLAYRGPKQRLRATPKEIRLAREEGVAFQYEHQPLECVGGKGVIGVRFRTPRGTSLFKAGCVILAMGQQAAPPPWLSRFEIVTESDGRIRVDEQGRTTHPKIWAGGDNSHGPDLAVVAMAAGRRAAEDILDRVTQPTPLRRST
ncbi:MAG: FAD-dependent oxidoreductase [Candidatus Thiodiazotropha sp.]